MKTKNLHNLFTGLATITLLLVLVCQVYAQPANNNCTSATNLAANATCTNGVTNAATLEASELTACLGAGIDQTVWYKFDATSSNMKVIIMGNEGNTCFFGSAIWDPSTSPCPVTAGTAISCISSATGPLSQLHDLTSLVIGETYLIQIGYNQGGACGSSADFCVAVYDNVVSSDACANAITVTSGAVYTVSNVAATPDKDLCSGSTENNIWFKWTVPAGWTGNGYVHLYGQVCDISAGMQLSVFKESSCGLIPEPAATTDCQFYANTQTTADIFFPAAPATWTPVAGEVYYFDLDGYAGTVCTFNFLVSPFTCFTTTVTTTTAASCGGNDGTATVTATGDDPFTYVWSTGGTTATISGLVAGTYTVTITDSKACTSLATATVTGPATSGFTTSGDYCTTGTGGTGVIFTNSGTSAASGATFSWTFTGGTPATSTAENPTVTWATVGSKAVSQTVTKTGCNATTNSSVTILDCTCPLTVNAGTDIVVCTSTTTALSGSYANSTGGANYLINDDFEGAFPGSWTVTGTTPTISSTQASSPTKSVYFNDNQSGAGGIYSMYQSFTAQTSFDVEFDIYLVDGEQSQTIITNGGTTASLWGPAVLFTGGNIAYNTTAGYIPVGTISLNTWHTIKLVISTGTNSFDMYLDGSLIKSAAGFYNSQSSLSRFYTFTCGTCQPHFYLDDIQVYSGNVGVLWTVAPACAGCLSSTTVLNPTFISAAANTYTYTLSITDDCATRTDNVTVTVNNCCNLTADAASNDNNNDTTFNMCTQPTLVMAGTYSNPVPCDPSANAINVTAADNTGCCGTLYDDAGVGGTYVANATDDVIKIGSGIAGNIKICFSVISLSNLFSGCCQDAITIKDGSLTVVDILRNADNGTTPCYTITTGTDGYATIEFHRKVGGSAGAAQPYAGFACTWTIVDNATGLIEQCDVNAGGGTASWSPATGLSSTTSFTPTFTPAAAGTYFYTLTVTDACGTATDDILINVESNVCIPGFSVNLATQLLAGNKFDFLNTGSTDLSTADPDWVFSWDMGGAGSYQGGTNSGSENPSFTYTSAGTYTVTQTLTHAAEGGCPAYGPCNITMQVTVLAACDNSCTAGFSVNNAAQVITSNIFSFTNTGSTGAGWTYAWDMGGAGSYQGGTNSGSENPSFTYSAVGNYTVTQTATNPPVAGCALTSCSTTMTVNVTASCSDATRYYYRSLATGNWNVFSTWQFSCDAGVTDPWKNVPSGDATLLPDYTKQTIVIRSGHTVTITASVTIDQTTVDLGGTLEYGNNAGSYLTINNGTGTDLIVNGTFIDNGPNSVRW